MALTGSLQSVMDAHFFTYLLPWLLTFAIVYGLLNQYGIPRGKQARAVISIVMAFLVMPVAAPVMAFLSTVGAGLIVLVAGILFFIILLELTSTAYPAYAEREGKIVGKMRSQKVTERHTKTFGGVVLILVLLIFIGAGGLDLIGFRGVSVNWSTLFFLGVIAIAVWWLVAEEK
ncbi:MAG: hypothetical protein DRP11_01365 [Candidatus Aenigmatarchaeota archaeon]|nr:MAG: hypothetical protein DRP11_01365 [Candidatus Aenigmarchaeota archaeon]